MNPLVIAGAISGGTSLLDSLFRRSDTKRTNAANLQIARETNANSMQIARENNQAQLNALRENNAFNRDMALEMFNLENEYNTPAHQKQLLLEAGLNPATMYQNGASQAVSDASTPSAASSGISSSMPNLVTPHMETPPSVTSALFANVGQFAEALSKISSSKLNDAQRNKLSATLDAELQNLLADKANKDANTAWTKLQTTLEQIYGSSQRNAELHKTIQDVYKTYNEAMLASSRNETEKAQKLLTEAETALRKSNNQVLQQQLPYLVQQAEESVKLIQQQQKTEQSKQSANYAAASASTASAKYTDEQREQLEKMWKDNLHIRHMQAEELSSKVELLQRTLDAQVNYLLNQGIISQAQVQQAFAEASMHEKENSAYWFTYVFDKLERTTKAAAAFKPFGSAGDVNTYTPLWSTTDTR